MASDSEEELHLHLDSEFEHSDDEWERDIDNDSDIDSVYEPEEESLESEDEGSCSSEALTGSDLSRSSSPIPHTFILLSDPFSDQRPNDLPQIEQDFPDVHPEILYENENHPYKNLG